MCDKPPGSEKANNECTTSGLQHLLEETERAAACDNTRKLYRMRKKWARCYLNDMEALSQIKLEEYVDGKSTSRSFSITQHSKRPPFRHRKPSRRKTTHPPWRRCSLPSGSYAHTEPQERIATPVEVYITCLDSLSPWLHRIIS